MKTVGIRALKNKLSHYIKIAAAGEAVLITDRDQVVAELVPARSTRARHVADAQLADMVRQGLLTPAILPPGPPPESEAVASLGTILGELDADRADR